MEICGGVTKLDCVGSRHEPWSLSCQVDERRPVGEVGDVGEDMLKENDIQSLGGRIRVDNVWIAICLVGSEPVA